MSAQNAQEKQPDNFNIATVYFRDYVARKVEENMKKWGEKLLLFSTDITRDEKGFFRNPSKFIINKLDTNGFSIEGGIIIDNSFLIEENKEMVIIDSLPELPIRAIYFRVGMNKSFYYKAELEITLQTCKGIEISEKVKIAHNEHLGESDYTGIYFDNCTVKKIVIRATKEDVHFSTFVAYRSNFSSKHLKELEKTENVDAKPPENQKTFKL